MDQSKIIDTFDTYQARSRPAEGRATGACEPATGAGAARVEQPDAGEHGADSEHVRACADDHGRGGVARSEGAQARRRADADVCGKNERTRMSPRGG